MGALDTKYDTSEELAEFLEEASACPLKDNKGKKINIKSVDVISRPELTKVVWAYVKYHELQDGRDIVPDEYLSTILGNRPINMLKIQTKLNEHLFLDDED